MRFFKHNALYLALLVVAVAVYSLFVTPWLLDTGHLPLAITGYGVFALLLVYGRANRRRKQLPNNAVAQETLPSSSNRRKSA